MASHRKSKHSHNHDSNNDSSKHEENKHSNESDSSDEIDLKQVFGKIKSFFGDSSKSKKYVWLFNRSKVILPYLLLIMIVFLAGYIRAMPVWLPVTDEWARSSINDQIRAQISSSINQQYPNLPPENRNRLVDEQLNQYINTNTAEYENQVAEVSQYFKSRLQTEDGQTYLTGIDPYFWFRYSRNLLETGIPGDEVKDGVQWDNKMNAPFGRPAPLESQVWISVWFHKFVSIFNSNIDLMTSMFYIPILVAPLAVIPAFFIAKKFAGIIAGLVAGFLMAVHPAFLVRTMGGFSDTDPYNIVFPLFIAWFMIEALTSKKLWKMLTITGLSIATVFLFAISWQGWWYIFLIMTMALFGYFIWLALINAFKENRPFIEIFKDKLSRLKLISLSLFFAGSLFLTGLLDNFALVTRIFYELPLSVVRIREVAQTNIWPNVLTTVAELNPSRNSQIISSLGGNLVFILSLLGILMTLMVRGKKHIAKEIGYVGLSFVFYLFVLRSPDALSDVAFAALLVVPFLGKVLFNFLIYKKEELRTVIITYALILSIWFSATVFATTRGVRFTMMIVPPFVLGLGLFAGVSYFLIRDVATKYLGLGKKLSAPLVSILILWLFMFGPISGDVYARGQSTAEGYIPSMNRAWFTALEEIRDNSAEDAIIFSWWDFGHWFKAIAERKVYFDGASQSEQPAHWVGKALLTQEENISLGVIRMLSCGRDKAYWTLTNYSPSTLDAVNLLYDIILMSRSDAEELMLSRDMPAEVVEDVLDQTHCIPPEVYYITSEDMVGKGGVWGHFGSWDFERAEIYMKVSKANNMGEGVAVLQDEYGYSSEDARSMYSEISSSEPQNWISSWPGFVSSGTPCSQRAEDLFLCRVRVQNSELNIVFNTTQGDAAIVVSQDQSVYPHSISFIDNQGRFVHKGYDEYQVPYAFSFVRDGGNLRVVLLDPLQATSMFTRLFFHGGAGTRFMDRFYDIRGITGGRILVWKIDWDSFLGELGDIEIDESELSATNSESTELIELGDFGEDTEDLEVEADLGLGGFEEDSSEEDSSEEEDSGVSIDIN